MGRSIKNGEQAHHPQVFVFDDVTVVHNGARKAGEGDKDLNPVSLAEVDRVSPHSHGFRILISAEHYEGKNVEVEGMIHVRLIYQLPISIEPALHSKSIRLGSNCRLLMRNRMPP